MTEKKKAVNKTHKKKKVTKGVEPVGEVRPDVFFHCDVKTGPNIMDDVDRYLKTLSNREEDLLKGKQMEEGSQFEASAAVVRAQIVMALDSLLMKQGEPLTTNFALSGLSYEVKKDKIVFILREHCPGNSLMDREGKGDFVPVNCRSLNNPFVKSLKEELKDSFLDFKIKLGMLKRITYGLSGALSYKFTAKTIYIEIYKTKSLWQWLKKYFGRRTIWEIEHGNYYD